MEDIESLRRRWEGLWAFQRWQSGFLVSTSFISATRPLQPDVSLGRTYPQFNHGHTVYLTIEEDRRVTKLRVLAFVLFGLTFTIHALCVEDPFRQKAPWEKKQW
jgi:hypothetical protein